MPEADESGAQKEMTKEDTTLFDHFLLASDDAANNPTLQEKWIYHDTRDQWLAFLGRLSSLRLFAKRTKDDQKGLWEASRRIFRNIFQRAY